MLANLAYSQHKIVLDSKNTIKKIYKESGIIDEDNVFVNFAENEYRLKKATIFGVIYMIKLIQRLVRK